MSNVIHGGNTSDINLVAALAAIGVNAETGAVQNSRGILRVYVLDAETNDKRYKTADLQKAWREGEPWVHKNPEHPFAYLMMAMKIRKEILDGIKNDKPLQQISRGDSHGFLHPDISEENEAKVVGGMS